MKPVLKTEATCSAPLAIKDDLIRGEPASAMEGSCLDIRKGGIRSLISLILEKERERYNSPVFLQALRALLLALLVEFFPDRHFHKHPEISIKE